MNTTTQQITHLYREITRLGQEALAHPVLAVRRGREMTALYGQIAALKAQGGDR